MTVDLSKIEAISNLDELISDADTVKSVAKIGLSALLEILGQESGGIYIPKNYRKREPIWFTLNPIANWVDESRNISPQLLFEITNFIEGKSRSKSNLVTNRLLLIPFYWKMEIQAVLVLNPIELQSDDQMVVQLGGNIIAREIFFH